jgi:hypothetical protein
MIFPRRSLLKDIQIRFIVSVGVHVANTVQLFAVMERSGSTILESQATQFVRVLELPSEPEAVVSNMH